MNILLALIGGEEFSPEFEEVHATLLADLDQENRRVVYLPTCAAEDGEEAIENIESHPSNEAIASIFLRKIRRDELSIGVRQHASTSPLSVPWSKPHGW